MKFFLRTQFCNPILQNPILQKNIPKTSMGHLHRGKWSIYIEIWLDKNGEKKHKLVWTNNFQVAPVTQNRVEVDYVKTVHGNFFWLSPKRRKTKLVFIKKKQDWTRKCHVGILKLFLPRERKCFRYLRIVIGEIKITK